MTSEKSWSGIYKRRIPKRKSRNNNYPELHPGQFDLLRNASLSLALTWSRGTFSPYVPVSLCTHLPMHSYPYTLVSLRTRLLTHSSLYALVFLYTHLTLRPYISRRNIPLRYLSKIVHLSRYHPRSSQYAMRKLSCWLDVIDAPLLCGNQPCHQLTRVTGWITSGHLQYIISSMTRDHLQYAIEYSGKLAQWQSSDGYSPSVCHQFS